MDATKPKVFRSLPQDQEDEAIRSYDGQIDQVVFPSKFLLGLSSEERQSLEYRDHWNGLFFYVFGYAQAKGWTDCDTRLNSRL